MKKQHPKVTANMFPTMYFLLVSLVALTQWAPIGLAQGRDPLAGLKRALSDSGAPALTSDQVTQLTALITARQNAIRSQSESTVLQTARRSYQNAILNGDNSAAQAQADIIASETASLSRTRLKDEAKFQIDVLNVLKTNDNQITLLSNRVGSEGLSRLLGSLAGPGGFLPGPRGGGPRGVFERAF